MHDIQYPPQLATLNTMFIDGGPVAAQSGAQIDVRDPATNQVIGSLPRASASDVNHAVQCAGQAINGAWRNLDPTARAHILHEIARRIRKQATLFTQIETIDVGKPLSQAERDVGRAADYFDYYAGMVDKLQGETIPLGRNKFSFTVLDPVGVTAHIVPWNYPISTVCRDLAPSLACGNTAVVKPAEDTSLSTLLLARITLEAGLPAGVMNVVTGLGEEAGDALARHPGVGHVAFTGSVNTGRHVMRAAADSLAGITLELGGKSPVTVLRDADLDLAVNGIVRGIFFNAGQICTAGSRLVVDESIHSELLEKVIARATTLTIDHGLKDPEMGPLVSQTQRQRVAGFVDRARAAGMEILTGGQPAEVPGLEDGAFYQPTVVDQVPRDAEIAQEEVFGPVLTVHTVSDPDEAVAAANDTRFGLVAGIYTRDIGLAMQFARDIRAGQVFINGYLQAGDTVPFGGFKESGSGRTKGLEALRNYCEVKAITTVF